MTMSFPSPFEKRMQNRLGADWIIFTQAHQEPSPISVRLNPKKECKIIGDPIPWSQYGRYLNERPVFTLDPNFHAGAYYVQEASSMFLEQAFKKTIDTAQPLRVLDLCAAPGGKSTHLLSLLNDDSLLVSNEVIRSRASILAENIQKWGYPNVIVSNNDPEDFQKISSFFDVIVIDAPCSGEGLFRKDKEAMHEWSMENVMLCSQRQRRVINDVWSSLKENGILIYCTCTFSEEENEDNLEWLSTHHNVEFIPIDSKPFWGIEEIKKGKSIGYRFYPHKVKGEGFFLSVIQKKESSDFFKTRPKKTFTLTSKKNSEQLKSWMQGKFQFIQQQDLLIAIPEKLYEDIEFLSNHLRIVTKGTALAQLKHEKLIPEHAIALSVFLNNQNFKSIELDPTQAISYLQKQNLQIGNSQKGFSLVTFEGNVLGWVNLLGNRINNLYPSNWRIRMSN